MAQNYDIVADYDVNGELSTFGAFGGSTYDLSSDWDAYGHPIRSTVNPWGTQIVVTNTYDESTGRALQQFVDKQTAATGAVQQTTYAYNPSGQVTGVRSIPDNVPSSTDLQCFSYDYLGRLTTAWSDTGTLTQAAQPSVGGQGSCANSSPTSGAQAPLRTTVGGLAAYWQSYGYDLTGNRTQLVQHDPSGNTAQDTTVTQTFPTPGTLNTPTTAQNTGGGTGGPHALLGSSTAGPSGNSSAGMQYDAVGNTTSITDPTGTATLTWDGEDKLTSYAKTGTAGPTTYTYDASGNQLVRRDPGRTTVTLGNDELVYDSNAKTLTGVRYYTIPGGVTLVRQGGTSTFQIADPHGTNTLALDGTTLTETRRPTDPFGNPRGTQPSTWAGDKGFVGGTQDQATGLTNLGAREYQPATGRFLNADPLLAPTDPQQWNGYSYGDNKPTDASDPTGYRVHDDITGLSFGMARAMEDNYAAHPQQIQQDLQEQAASYKKAQEEHPTCLHDCTPHSVKPDYTYTYKEDIGPVAKAGLPIDVMSMFLQSPAQIFPFPVSGCSSFYDGSHCELHPGPAMFKGDGTVEVVLDTPTSFTFIVESDRYFDRAGSTIRFSLSDEHNELYLTQHGEARSNSALVSAGKDAGFIHTTWKDMAHNLRTELGVAPSKPQIDWTSPGDWADLIGGNWDQFQ
ncbi:RHS repeat-associated core domain-containing protein [Kitasatospora sp. GAS204B]|uniref:RHS repeat domain-containing protein n=1 Tax=unclassified Kitasatospora TaxID=2633591 RepID=UPI0024749A45|nr:RHS repeat-associated core domain-containing protein [Kitasatospora sp. GAS204B]